MYKPSVIIRTGELNSTDCAKQAHLLALATVMNGTVQDNVITINNCTGTGEITAIEPLPGLEILCWNLRFNQYRLFNQIPVHGSNPDVYSILYTTTPDQFLVKRKRTGNKVTGVMLKSADEDFDVLIAPMKPACAVTISFTSAWLAEEFRQATPAFRSLVETLFGRKQNLFFTETISFALHHTFQALLEDQKLKSVDIYAARTRASAIVYDVIHKLMPVHCAESNTIDNMLYARMNAVEQMLQDYLYSQLPPLAEIARTVAVSESTLKRSFKKVYGVGIYECYLQKKMQLARQLLDENTVPVKELAFRLGYEKTSNFIKIFKKYYSLSPGALKKSCGS